MSLISKIQSLISSANAVTGESRTDLTSAVQDLKDGYGGSTVEKGLVFSEYDSDGYPHKAEFVGTWTSVPGRFGYYICVSNQCLLGKITSIKIPDTVTEIGGSAFAEWRTLQQIELPDADLQIGASGFMGCRGLTSITFKRNVRFSVNSTFSNCIALTSVTFGGDIPRITNDFVSNTATMLYDFSNATSVPTLYSVASLGHANGCVIKVPQSLLADWQAETNWSALTNVTWQGV